MKMTRENLLSGSCLACGKRARNKRHLCTTCQGDMIWEGTQAAQATTTGGR